MPRFLIQVPHDPDPWGCAEVVEVFLRTGSHYLTHADWGCTDGVHTAWMIVDVDSRDDALRIVPSAFRGDAEVVRLNAFTLEGLAKLMRHHPRPNDAQHGPDGFGKGPLPTPASRRGSPSPSRRRNGPARGASRRRWG